MSCRAVQYSVVAHRRELATLLVPQLNPEGLPRKHGREYAATRSAPALGYLSVSHPVYEVVRQVRRSPPARFVLEYCDSADQLVYMVCEGLLNIVVQRRVAVQHGRPVPERLMGQGI